MVEAERQRHDPGTADPAISRLQTGEPAPGGGQRIDPSVIAKDHPEALIPTGKLAANLDTRVVTVEDTPAHLTGKDIR